MHLIVNIGNEVGKEVSESDFKSGYEAAVNKMRTAGIHVPLMIDACNYGQNIDILQSCGPSLISADPDKNLLFSIHMWWPYSFGYTDQRVIDELAESASMNLPLVVGEFGNKWDETESGKIPYKLILENCYKNQIGYIAWEWGPGNNLQTFLDMTSDSTYATLKDWGLEVAVTDKYSIQNIAKRPVSMLSSLPPALPSEPLPPGNLALNKPVTVSSTESSLNSGNNAVDGDMNSRWASDVSDPNWIYVDLGAKEEINKVIICWEAAYASQYKIQVSDDAASWTDVYTQYNGQGKTETINLTGSGRYLRIYGMQRYNTSWPYSIYELGVYGPQSALSASISPDVAVFDKNPAKQADIAVTLSPKANTLNAVKNGDSVLVPGTDYTVDGTNLIIKKEYLSNQPIGTSKFTFDYSDGVDPVLAIAIGDTSPSAYITPSIVDFNRVSDKQADITVTMAPNYSTLLGIKNDTSSLVLGTDYTVSGNNVTIKKEYLAQQPVGMTKLTFDFDKGFDPVLRVNVNDTSPSSTIAPASSAFEKKSQSDVSVTMTLNGNTLSAIKSGSTALIAGTDYTVSDNIVTIKKEYLAAQPVGTTALTFDFSSGIDPVLNIKVTDTALNSAIALTSAIVYDMKSPTDVNVTMTLNGNTLSSIKNGSAELVSGKDYTVDGNIVTIKKEYLAAQSSTSIKLTFGFSAGVDAVLTISDHTVPSGLKIESFNSSKDASTNSPAPRFRLTNTGSEAINLSNVKIRYYYTMDGTQAQNFWCDWSSVGSSNVVGTFVTMASPKTNADCYLEISFKPEAGSLAANQSIEVQGRFAKSDWTNYNQSNDYSFDAEDNTYNTWSKVTSYIFEVLSSGIEP